MTTTLPLGEVKAHLSDIVGRVHDHHERITVTVYGLASKLARVRSSPPTSWPRRCGAGWGRVNEPDAEPTNCLPTNSLPTDSPPTYSLRTTPTARRALAERLPDEAARIVTVVDIDHRSDIYRA